LSTGAHSTVELKDSTSSGFEKVARDVNIQTIVNKRHPELTILNIYSNSIRQSGSRSLELDSNFTVVQSNSSSRVESYNTVGMNLPSNID
jgi:hypothetical protein